MKATRKVSRVQEAYARCKPARDLLFELDGRCMETTEDDAGIVWERWLIRKGPLVTSREGHHQQPLVSVILFSTPHWWEVFAPVTDKKGINETLEAIREFTKQ
jgi:hypothetical protein